MITHVTKADVLAECRQTLGLACDSKNPLDDTMLAALLRRSAGIHCPCSRTTLRASLLESLQYLDTAETELSERVDTIIEGLIIGGDLLELHDVTAIDPKVRGTWVFAAPPSFVLRTHGDAFLLGIVPNQDVYLPQSLTSRITYNGLARVIAPEPDEDLPNALRELGLQQLTVDAWLKSPAKVLPEEHLDRLTRRLLKQPPSGSVDDLEVLDPGQPVTYYRGRWKRPVNLTGTFVARRPQKYGAPIWCFAELKAGTVVRFLDLPLKKSRWRGCDEAWHLQMAIDHSRQSPQIYRRDHDGDGVRLNFYTPLPEWSQRRLMILGTSVPRQRSLMSYWLPAEAAESEERFLQERLWLSCLNDAG